MEKLTHKPFLVKIDNKWIDIVTDEPYVEFTDIPYDQCEEGLCNRYGRVILKNLGYPKKVFIAKNKPKDLSNIKPITVKFQLSKEWKNWTFEALDISEVKKGIEEELSSKEIAIRVCAPESAVESLLEKLGGERYGRISRNRSKRERKAHRNSITRERKNAG